ncbi:MAG TPA: hypothetical protein VFH77_17500 [Streptomyces sp.]|nr:hypothetical protein [Streptomyces sp.]
MATGPDHYREAEQLLKRAQHFTYGDGGDASVGLAFAQEATAHATLALAAAVAMQAPVDGCEPGMTPREHEAWRRAAGVTTPNSGDAQEPDESGDNE